MGALKGDHVRRAAFAPIERKIFAHDSDRLGPTGVQVFGTINRMPEQTHVTTANRFRSRAVLVHVAVHIDSSRSRKNALATLLSKSNFVSQSSGFDSFNGAKLILIGSAAGDSHGADYFISIHD